MQRRRLSLAVFGIGRFLHYSTLLMASPANIDTNLTARVQALIEEVLAPTPHFLVELDVRGAIGSQVVNAYIDSDSAIGVDDLARISREVEFLLDTEDLFPARYQLNVSTPGVGRPLKLIRQYHKNIGRTLHVHFEKEPGVNTEVTGTLQSVTEAHITVEDPNKGAQEIPFDAILWAKVKLPW